MAETKIAERVALVREVIDKIRGAKDTRIGDLQADHDPDLSDQNAIDCSIATLRVLWCDVEPQLDRLFRFAAEWEDESNQSLVEASKRAALCGCGSHADHQPGCMSQRAAKFASLVQAEQAGARHCAKCPDRYQRDGVAIQATPGRAAGNLLIERRDGDLCSGLPVPEAGGELEAEQAQPQRVREFCEAHTGRGHHLAYITVGAEPKLYCTHCDESCEV